MSSDELQLFMSFSN